MDDVLRYTWAQYRVWAATSRSLKARVTRWGMFVLVLTLVGTAVGTMVPFFKLGPPLKMFLPWLAGAALGLAAYITAEMLGDRAREAWVEARALAEALKSDCFKYVTRTPPYDTDAAPAVLAQRAGDLVRLGSGTLPVKISEDDRVKGAPEAPWSIEDYVTGRLRDQINGFYLPAIERHTRSLTRGRRIAFGFGAAAVILSVSSGAADTTAGSGLWIGALLGSVTTAAAALAAWFQSGNHLENALNYQQAITRLELLEKQRHVAGADRRLVIDAEAIFQAEHSAWLSQWTNPPGPASESKVTSGPVPPRPPQEADALSQRREQP